jgi:hypothetical protein
LAFNGAVGSAEIVLRRNAMDGNLIDNTILERTERYWEHDGVLRLREIAESMELLFQVLLDASDNARNENTLEGHALSLAMSGVQLYQVQIEAMANYLENHCARSPREKKALKLQLATLKEKSAA